MRIRISPAGRRNALAILPLLASGAALAWPQTPGGLVQGALAVAGSPSIAAASPAATPLSTPCIPPLCTSPSPSASAKPSPTPTATHPPTPHPTNSGGGGGGGNPAPVPPPPTAVGPAFTAPTPADSGNLVGASSGPPTPPAVPGTSLQITADPPNAGPGTSALITVTVSGSRGSDRYAVTNAAVTLELVEKPESDATLSSTSLTTDVAGSAIAKLTLSKTRGRHVVKATSSGLSGQVLVDTLAGARASSTRAHHDGILAQVKAPAIDPSYLVDLAGLILVVSFLLPYRRRAYAWLRRRPSGPRTPREVGDRQSSPPPALSPAPVAVAAAVAEPPWPVVPSHATAASSRPSAERQPRRGGTLKSAAKKPGPATASAARVTKSEATARARIPAASAPPLRPGSKPRPRVTKAEPAAEPKLSSGRKIPRAPRSAAPGA